MPTRLQLSCRVAIEYGLPLYLLTGDKRKKQISSKNGSKSGLDLPHGACVEICREMSLFEDTSNRDDSAPGLQWGGFAEQEGFKSGMKETVGDGKLI